MWLVFRVSAMRSMVPMVEEGERGSFLLRSFFFLLSRFIATCSQSVLALLCLYAYYARRALRRGDRGAPLLQPPPTLLAHPSLSPFSTGTSTERSSVRSRSRSPKTTAAAAAENRCSTPYNHIVVLPSPPSPPSPSSF